MMILLMSRMRFDLMIRDVGEVFGVEYVVRCFVDESDNVR